MFSQDSPGLLVLSVERLMLRRLFLGVLLREVTPDDAAANRADHGVMARVVPRDAADYGPLEAARCVCRAADGKNERCGGEGGFPESCHADVRYPLVLSALFGPMLRRRGRFQ